VALLSIFLKRTTTIAFDRLLKILLKFFHGRKTVQNIKDDY
jgi:hypothetical protein